MTSIPSPATTAKTRLLSLDFFRGATVAAMILVNNPGSWSSIYWPLEHAEWNGCTPTDWIMPFFLFIVGVSIAYAMDGRASTAADKRKLFVKAAQRAAVLFLLGLALSFYPGSPAQLATVVTNPLDRFEFLRIMGVLQRIAVVYLACVCLLLVLKPRQLIWATGAIVLLYWAALTFVPVPSAAPISAATTRAATQASTLPTTLATTLAVAEPARWIPANLSKDDNLGAWVDRTLLTTNHLYLKANHDPEGPFSTLSAIASGLIGVVVGLYLKRGTLTPGALPHDIGRRIAVIAAWGVGLAVAGWAWGLVHPLNKSLWTSSYTLYTGGLAALCLAGSYFFIDYLKPPAILKTLFVTPFVAFGVNAITAFWASGFMVRTCGLLQVPYGEKTVGLNGFFYRTHITPRIANPELASLTYALIFVTLWTGIVLLMYRKKWIIKV